MKEFGEKNTSIDRIDNGGNYCKENCRWATWIEQCEKKEKTGRRLLTLNNQTLGLREWAKKNNVSFQLLQCRLKNGWSIKKTLTTPKQTKYLRRKKFNLT